MELQGNGHFAVEADIVKTQCTQTIEPSVKMEPPFANTAQLQTTCMPVSNEKMSGLHHSGSHGNSNSTHHPLPPLNLSKLAHSQQHLFGSQPGPNNSLGEPIRNSFNPRNVSINSSEANQRVPCETDLRSYINGENGRQMNNTHSIQPGMYLENGYSKLAMTTTENRIPETDNRSPGIANRSPGIANRSPGTPNTSPGTANASPGTANRTLGTHSNETNVLQAKSPLQRITSAACTQKDCNDVGNRQHHGFLNVDKNVASERMFPTRRQCNNEAPGSLRTSEQSWATRKISSCSMQSQASTRSVGSLSSRDGEKLSLMSASDRGGSDVALCSRMRSLHCHSLPTTATQRKASVVSGPASLSGVLDSKTHVRQLAIQDPDAIVWADVQKCVVRRNEEGRLGFRVLDVERKDDIYAMVTFIDKHSPVASSGLQCGDRILAINGKALHSHGPVKTNNKNSAAIIKEQDCTEPVCLTLQSPRAVRTISRTENSTMNILTRQVSSSDAAKDRCSPFLNDYSPMTRLPDLRLVILGCDSEYLAEQLVGQSLWMNSEQGPLASKCLSVIERRSNYDYDWSSAREYCRHHDIMEVLKSLEKRKVQRSSSELLSLSCNGIVQASEYMALELVAVKDCPLGQYCSQLFMTSHCLYMVQFDGQSFLRNPGKEMGKLQVQLDKIRTYAGDDAPVYLLSTWETIDRFTPQLLEDIGNKLQQRFGATYGKQLQYHGNCPCFMLSVPLQSPLQSPSSDLCYSDQDQEGEAIKFLSQHDQRSSTSVAFRTQNSTSTIASASSMASSSTCFSDFGPENCLVFLRDHITVSIFDQKFLASCSRSLPQVFLHYREIVMGMRQLQQKCVMTSRIKEACDLQDSSELASLLEYLHRQGVIFSPATTLQTQVSQFDFVVLNPFDIVHICTCLLEIPDVSYQDPGLRRHWLTLRTKSVLTPTLLEYFLGADSDKRCLTICLQQLNLIYPRCDMELSETSHDIEKTNQVLSYYAPYYFPNISHDESRYTHHPNDQVLLADFLGHCPHGQFTRIMLQLCQVANFMSGSYLTESSHSWIFNMGGNYTLYVHGELSRCLIHFVVKCRVGFGLQNVLGDIYSAMQEVVPQGRKFTLGPICPLGDECKDDPGVTPHVIDLGNGCEVRPLWCGDKDVSRFNTVKQWITKSTQISKQKVNSKGRVLSRDCPIRKLPADVVQLVCEKLNVHSETKRDWRGLAGELNYTFEDVQAFQTASTLHWDPCGHLLADWGQTGQGNLGDLLAALRGPRLKRLDVVSQLTSQWQIVDTSYC